MYNRLDKLMDNQSFFDDFADPIIGLGEELPSAKKIELLANAVKFGTYLSDLNRQDRFSMEALQQFLNGLPESKKMTDTVRDAFQNVINDYEGNGLFYAGKMLALNEGLDWFMSGTGLGDKLLGTQGSAAMIVWDFASAAIPYISEGLTEANQFELCCYAYVAQSDALQMYQKNRDTYLAGDVADQEALRECLYSAYTFLKMSVIAREAGIQSVLRLHDEIPEYIQELQEKNQKLEEMMARIKCLFSTVGDSQDMVDVYGFTPEQSEKRISNYGDDALIQLLNRLTGRVSDNELKQMLEEYTGKEVVCFQCDDYDGDGGLEAFGLVGELDREGYGDDGIYFGELYFVGKGKIQQLCSANGYWMSTLKKFEFGDVKFFGLGEYFATGDLTYVFGVDENGAYEPSVSRKGQGLTQTGENTLTILQSAYDGTTDGSGHTWKPYYLYWDGFDFKEYGGMEISQEQFLRCAGAQAVADEIANRGCWITNIFYRENGMIHINYTDGFSNSNATLRLSNGQVQLIDADDGYSVENPLADSSYGGVYAAALIPEIATYPAGFPVQ